MIYHYLICTLTQEASKHHETAAYHKVGASMAEGGEDEEEPIVR